jgi:hypothetical protein
VTASSRGGSGSPYDTSADVREVLARIKAPGEGPDASSIALPQRLLDRHSGFLDRLVDDYFTTGSIPVRLKDVGKARFGVPTEENTLTWGDSTDQLSFSAAPVEVVSTTTRLALHITRPRPTTFTLLTTLDFSGPGWNVEGNATFTIFYTVGVGQTRTTVRRVIQILGPTLTDTQPVVDVITLPLQSLVASAKLDATNNNTNQAHGVQLTILAAPVVQ